MNEDPRPDPIDLQNQTGPTPPGDDPGQIFFRPARTWRIHLVPVHRWSTVCVEWDMHTLMDRGVDIPEGTC